MPPSRRPASEANQADFRAPTMHDIVEFLRRHAPFDDLSEAELEELAQSAEVEFFAAGATIFRQQEGPMKHVRMVRRGAVELRDGGRVLDLLGEGELFGHPSMLSGLPTGFEARAGEDTLCYRLPADAVIPLLSRPAGVRYVARSLLARPRPDLAAPTGDLDPAQQPVARLVHKKPVICDPGDAVREAARRMAEAEATAALVRLPDGQLGILTDHDLRDRVVAGDVGVDAPVTEVMSFPAFTVTPERLGAEVTLEMLDRDIRHVPVVWPHGEVLGVLSDRDLLAAETRAPFALRRAIDDADDVDGLRRAAGQLRPAVIALSDAEYPPAQIASIIAVVTDALTRRLMEFAVGELGAPPCPVSWLALGSLGRREVVPSSDVDSALVWDGRGEEQERYMQALGARVVGELTASGFAADPHGATAAQPLFDRSFDAWRELIRTLIEHPDRDKALVFLSLLFDARSVHAIGDARDPLDELRQAWHRPTVLRLMLRLALGHQPPTGFRRFRTSPRDFVVDRSGEHRGRLDIKGGGLLPIVGIARYASVAAGVRTTSTRERLSSAATAGTLDGRDARTLAEAHDLFWRLRLEHQVEQMRQGAEPDDYIDIGKLNPLTRRYLREAFHAVSAVQRSLKGTLALPP
jgi:CBS domain-containing protein